MHFTCALQQGCITWHQGVHNIIQASAQYYTNLSVISHFVYQIFPTCVELCPLLKSLQWPTLQVPTSTDLASSSALLLTLFSFYKGGSLQSWPLAKMPHQRAGIAMARGRQKEGCSGCSICGGRHSALHAHEAPFIQGSPSTGDGGQLGGCQCYPALYPLCRPHAPPGCHARHF